MNALYTINLQQALAFLKALHISHYVYTCYDDNNNPCPAISVANGRFHIFFTANGDISSIADY